MKVRQISIQGQTPWLGRFFSLYSYLNVLLAIGGFGGPEALQNMFLVLAPPDYNLRSAKTFKYRSTRSIHWPPWSSLSKSHSVADKWTLWWDCFVKCCFQGQELSLRRALVAEWLRCVPHGHMVPTVTGSIPPRFLSAFSVKCPINANMPQKN